MAGNNGASQFSAFAALTGFDDLIIEHNQIYEARREPSEEELQNLSNKMQQVKKGMSVTVKCYSNNKYETLTGKVSKIDLIYRTIRVDNKTIFFDDIFEICSDEFIEY